MYILILYACGFSGVHKKLIVYVIQLLVKQELPTIPEHLSSPPVFSEVRVTRSLVFFVLCL